MICRRRDPRPRRRAIEAILADVPDEHAGAGQAGAHAVGARGRDPTLRATSPRRPSSSPALRRRVREIAEAQRAAAIGAAGTHPFARCEDQQIVERPRYRELVDELGFIAEQELIFGTHVHVGIDDADKAIYVADGMRGHLPLLLALSTNSPFWRGQEHGDDVLAHAGLPRLPARGGPAALRELGDLRPPGRADDARRARSRTTPTCGGTCARTRTSARSRPRVFDQQTRLEHTLALAALTQSLAHRFAELFDEGDAARRGPVRADRRQQGARRACAGSRAS